MTTLFRIAAIVALVAVSGCSGEVASAEQALFARAFEVRVGQGSAQPILADLNRDRRLDIVTRRLQHRELAVLLGNRIVGFKDAAGGRKILAYEPARMAHADVNHDGTLDLAVTHRDANQEKVDILPGDRKGGFHASVGSPFISNAAIETYKPDIYFADVNEDGHLDIVTANGRRNTIEILMGDGRGGFGRASILSLEAGQDRYSFGIGDIDADGHIDIATAASSESGRPGYIALFGGDGRGGFNEGLGSRIVVSDPYMASVADLNGDRRADLIIAHRETSKLSILFNQGRGRFETVPVPIDSGMAAFHVVVADVNRDGKVDVIAATVKRFTPPDESRIAVFLGGSRGFSPAPGSPYPVGPGAYDFGVGDLNDDGKLDIVASSFAGESLTVLLGQ